jgi:high-affinity iron transporter
VNADRLVLCGSRRRRFGARLTVAVVLALAALLLVGSAAGAAPRHEAGSPVTVAKGSGSVSKDEAIKQLDKVRVSIDQTLKLLDAGKRQDAFRISKAGYLDHFEAVEIPLVIVDPNLKLDAEGQFADVRNAINDNHSTADIRSKIVKLRATIDTAERKLSSQGAAPFLVFGQAFVVLLREGLEAVLLLSVLLGYLESTKNSQYKRPILYGVFAAILASAVTFFAVDALFAVLPFGREVLEAIVGVLAVAVLFYVSFWLVARLEQRRWLEFLKARVWTAVSAGSAFSLAMIGFTSVYREGFEMALFMQALSSFGAGMGVWVAAGVAAGAAVLAVISFAVFKLGKTIPVRAFLTVAVIVVMATSVTILGNAMYSLQEAAVLDMHRLTNWPRLPIFLAQATGYYPTFASVLAQILLTVVYVVGGIYTFVIRPRRLRRRPDAVAEPAQQGPDRAAGVSAPTAVGG